MRERWDAMVVGGGPAGGLTALRLAESGWRVLLVEAHRVLPARVCGAYLCPAGVALLDRLGLRAELAGGARQIEGMILHAPDFRRLVTRFPGVKGVPSYGLALRRPDFDERMLRLAEQAGAEVRMGEKVTGIDRVESGWRLRMESGWGAEAPLLVGADGRKSLVARQTGLALPAPRKRVALHADVAALEEAPPFGEMHVFRDGSYVGLNNLSSWEVNVSTVCDPAALRGVAPHEFLNRQLASSPHLRARVSRVAGAANVGATFPSSHVVRRASGPGVALVGDAGGFIDPLTGEGIYMALWMAEALTGRLVTAGPAVVEEALAAYGAARAGSHRGKQRLNLLFQRCIVRPAVANGILRVLACRRGVGDAFVGLIGNQYRPALGVARMMGAFMGIWE